jgi:hypothetical protein
MSIPAHARVWLEQRRSGELAISEVEARELATLDPGDALAQAEALLAAAPIDAMAGDRRTSSGFVEQQRVLSRRR